MFRFLFLLLIVIPALEIWGFIAVGHVIGGFNTFLLVIATAILGAFLTKREGLQILREAQRKINYGQLPGQEILDGISVLIGGLLLLTPGFFTDAIGLLFLFPVTRQIFKYYLLEWLRKQIRSGRFHINIFRRW